ncbi:MAG: hypothetical protein FJ123_00875 [Deltaproteobacteria bacterium]|nr:hypothetical protein [Deltaproteobacteria bacterium]
MRVIVVITSPNRNEYEGPWCHRWTTTEENPDVKKIPVAQDRLMLVFNGKPDACGDCETKISKDIRTILVKLESDFQLAILCHGISDRLDAIKNLLMMEEALKELVGKLSDSEGTKCYHQSQGSIYKDYLNPFSEKDPDVNLLFDNLWGKLHGESNDDRVEKACRLRAEILTPLVALDLLRQAKNQGITPPTMDDLKDRIWRAIGGLGGVSGIVKRYQQIGLSCEGYKEPLRNLLAEASKDLGDLEENFGKDLKDVAEQMEDQINSI